MKHFYNEKQKAFSAMRWLRVMMAVCLFAGMSVSSWALNYVRVENPAGEGEAFETWDAAIEYLNELPELADGGTYAIKLMNSSGVTMGGVMPDKPCIITTQSIKYSDKYPLTLPTAGVVNLSAPLTFDKLTLKGGKSTIYANGHKIEFTKEVKMDYNLNLTVYGGTAITNVASTEVVLNGGTFEYVYGGCENANVIGNTSVIIDGTVSIKGKSGNASFAGGCKKGSVQGGTSTEIQKNGKVTITNGYLLGGCYDGDVRGSSKLSISGGLTLSQSGASAVAGGYGPYSYCDKTEVLISENASVSTKGIAGLFAGAVLGSVGEASLWITGGNSLSGKFGAGGVYGSVESATVEVSGNPIFSSETYILGGGIACRVKGDTKVMISGGTGTNTTICGGNYASASNQYGTPRVDGAANVTVAGGKYKELYGADFAAKGTVNNVNVCINNTAENSGMLVFGGGRSGGAVTGNVEVLVKGGMLGGAYLLKMSGNCPDPTIAGDATLEVEGGTINQLGVTFHPQMSLPASDYPPYGTVGGKANIIINGTEAQITELKSFFPYERSTRENIIPATLTFKDYGTASRPATVPCDIELFSVVEADNSFITMNGKSFVVYNEFGLELLGKTWQLPAGDKFQLKSYKDELLTLNQVVVATDEWAAADFNYTNDTQTGTTNFYQVGNTIRYDDGTQTFHTVTINEIAELEKGILEVVWDGTVVKSGDKLPQVEDKPLMATVTPALGYSAKLFKGEEEQTGLSLETVCDADMVFSATFEEKNYTVTYGQVENGTIAVQNVDGETIDSGTEVVYKSTNKIVITPDAGYRIAANAPTATYVEDGQAEDQTLRLTPVEGEPGCYSFEMPAGNVTMTVAFEAIDYKIVLVQPKGGTISADKEIAHVGGTVTLVSTADSNYDFKRWIVTDAAGNAVEVSVENTFVMPASDVTVTAEFRYNPPYLPSYYDLRFEANDSVLLSANKMRVIEGSSFTITAEAAAGYDPETLVVEYKKGRNGKWQTLNPDSKGKYCVRNVYNDIYVRASIEPLGDPTAIGRVEDGKTSVRALGRRICIMADEPLEMRIVGIGGRVARTSRLAAGYNEISGLEDGIYIVLLSDGTRCKVAIR